MLRRLLVKSPFEQALLDCVEPLAFDHAINFGLGWEGGEGHLDEALRKLFNAGAKATGNSSVDELERLLATADEALLRTDTKVDAGSTAWAIANGWAAAAYYLGAAVALRLSGATGGVDQVATEK